jgi:hypothetical protein
MKVKCITNKGDVLPLELFDNKSGYSARTEFQLIIEKEYVVYAITHIKKNVWFLVCDEASVGNHREIYPQYLPSTLFEITDSRLSKYWQVGLEKDKYDSNRIVLAFGFKELLENEYFLGNLWEDSETEKNIFLKYKLSMDNEFI